MGGRVTAIGGRIPTEVLNNPICRAWGDAACAGDRQTTESRMVHDALLLLLIHEVLKVFGARLRGTLILADGIVLIDGVGIHEIAGMGVLDRDASAGRRCPGDKYGLCPSGPFEMRHAADDEIG